MLEQLFDSSVLDVVVPDTSIEYPPRTDTDEWLGRLKTGTAERRQAFFDEQLHFFLIARIDHPTLNSNASADVSHPPSDLIAFLAHLQVSFEAMYISSIPNHSPDTPFSHRASAPPRSTSFAKFNDSFHPPSTPIPTPSTAEHDRRYIRSDGTILLAGIWGQDASEDSPEAFSLLFSKKENVWVAVYKLCVTVSFLRLQFNDPLLCLTVSSTLRDKPLATTRSTHPLFSFLTTHGALPITSDPPTPISTDSGGATDENQIELNCLGEVNLLGGLSSGTTFSAGSELSLSTTRLGSVTRRRLFSLPPVAPTATRSPSPTPTTARAAHATLRKSFRKTLRTVSGFRVRMRTVFVPYVLLPDSNESTEGEDELDERERREAGNEERTVVLCVEVENSGEAGPAVSFVVEAVGIKIGGEGARTALIGWADGTLKGNAEKSTFPLLIGPMEQYNLLYAVSFLRSPEESEALSLNKRSSIASLPSGPSITDLQRAVTLNIQGKPYVQLKPAREGDTMLLALTDGIQKVAESGRVSFPTQSFSSRWNCVLDLSVQRNDPNAPHRHGDDGVGNSVLPEPASPFPTFSPRMSSIMAVNSAFTATPSPQAQAIAGSKRHTLSEFSPGHLTRSSTPTYYQASPTPAFNLHGAVRDRQPLISSKLAAQPLTFQLPATPTTYAPPLMESDEGGSSTSGASSQSAGFRHSMTPAYPAYPTQSALPPTPLSMPPIAHQLGSVGPSVEIKRERGMIMGSAVPQTPGPLITTAFAAQGVIQLLKNVEEKGQAIILSIGAVMRGGKEKIFPLDQFTLDIFVFNQSSWTRRLEVSCPNRRRRRKTDEGGSSSLGILPLNNRVRVGPLRPTTCQSVRMEFLALVPGVHCIDVLTLTDVESGFAVNLRSVMDIVVHESID